MSGDGAVSFSIGTDCCVNSRARIVGTSYKNGIVGLGGPPGDGPGGFLNGEMKKSKSFALFLMLILFLVIVYGWASRTHLTH